MTARLADRFDPLRAAIGLFVVLGVALTGVAGYAMLPANVSVSADLAVSLLSGVSLVAFAVLVTRWLHGQTERRRPGRGA